MIYRMLCSLATVMILMGLVRSSVADGATRYERYSLLQLRPLVNMTQVDVILGLREKYEDERTRNIIFFDDVIIPVKRLIKFIVSPDHLHDVENYLRTANIEYTVVIDDIKRTLDEHRELNERQKAQYLAATETGRVIAPDFVMSYDKMAALLESWANNYPTIASFKSIGLTSEQRETFVLTINGDREDLPAVWIDAGIDPRVWLSSSSAVYIAFKLLHGEDDDIVRLRSKYRWFIVPVVNPDGYEYSIEHDRFWRKTRTPYDNGCFGADMNRNFDVHWVGAGSTLDPCADRHRGPKSFSELETQNLADAIRKSNLTSGGLLAYFSLQSYGQYILAPWTGRDMMKTEDYEYLLVVAKDAISAVESSSDIPHETKTFKFGTPPDLRFPVSGSVLDWVRKTLEVKYLYALDLTPAAVTAADLDADESADRHPLGISQPATAVYVGGEQAFTIVTRTLAAIEAGPVVDMLQIYASEELARQQHGGYMEKEVELGLEAALNEEDNSEDEDDDEVEDDDNSRDEL